MPVGFYVLPMENALSNGVRLYLQLWVKQLKPVLPTKVLLILLLLNLTCSLWSLYPMPLLYVVEILITKKMVWIGNVIVMKEWDNLLLFYLLVKLLNMTKRIPHRKFIIFRDQFSFEYLTVKLDDLEMVYFAEAIRIRPKNGKNFGYMKTNDTS